MNTPHQMTTGEKFAHETQASLASLLHDGVITEAEFDFHCARIRSALTTEHLITLAANALKQRSYFARLAPVQDL